MRIERRWTWIKRMDTDLRADIIARGEEKERMGFILLFVQERTLIRADGL